MLYEQKNVCGWKRAIGVGGVCGLSLSLAPQVSEGGRIFLAFLRFCLDNYSFLDNAQASSRSVVCLLDRRRWDGSVRCYQGKLAPLGRMESCGCCRDHFRILLGLAFSRVSCLGYPQDSPQGQEAMRDLGRVFCPTTGRCEALLFLFFKKMIK